MLRTIAILVLFGALQPAAVNGQVLENFSADTPSWVLVQRGDQLLREQQTAAAIELYNEALAREGTLPEALIGLGTAYLGSGDDQLALRELQLALDQEQFLYTPEDRYRILYLLADTFIIRGEQRKLQDTLLSIVDDDPYFSDPEHQDARRNYRRVLQQEGVDHLFRLYRLPEIFSRKAHRELGMQFLLQNLPSQAVDHLIFAMLMGFSEVIEEMRRIFPMYQYSSVLQTYQDIFTDDPRTAHLREYLLHDSFTAELLYLADAFYIEGQQALANALWRLVAEVPGPVQIQERARRQLQEPTMPDTFIRRMIDERLIK
ncbi:tetratricopeptide repeat protein [Spirochaeta africana]|uniref:Uncharacterized protein n=1 Tax=Spirochaeta africana (strain ATCC 700263 / DSM 8902 / Z-7692) TaxID=889378 RepID=H9UJK5_SPIAZ|nr:hypothetical protein [Spirochaeta africana]AFG37698.1 hypothetical protein Spiaf_1640 [Spirochaeta africana DSM 8902]